MTSRSLLRAHIYIGYPFGCVPDYLLDNNAPRAVINPWKDCGTVCLCAWIEGADNGIVEYLGSLEEAKVMGASIGRNLFDLVDMTSYVVDPVSMGSVDEALA